MRLSAKDFRSRLDRGTLCLTLVGMSGMGKSYRAMQLAALGFTHQCCDDLIAERISELLPTRDMAGLAAWMGQPDSPGYQERQDQYLALEETVTGRALKTGTGNRVIDTTGSVIYLSPELLEQLTANSVIVYLEADQSVYDVLFEVYLRDPKPIVWGSAFQPRARERSRDALARCYCDLLRFRSERYEALADVVLPYPIARDETTGGAQFLKAIERHLVR